MKLKIKLFLMLVLASSIMITTSCKKDDPTLPKVETGNFVAKTNGTAEGGGSVTDDGFADITARGVCYSQVENPTISDQKTSDGTGQGVFTSKLSQLAPGFTYHVRAYATNSVGTSYGSDVVFTVPL